MTSERSEPEDPAERELPPPEVISTTIGGRELDRVDRLAAKRGVDRAGLLRQAIDALLAQEAWVGGFEIPPPASHVPAAKSGRLRRTLLRRRSRSGR